MNPVFSPDYASARTRFCELAQKANARLERHTHPSARGPHGEELSVDVARLGSAQPERLYLVSSGVHGIEGFVGSAAQCGAIEQRVFSQVPDDTAVVLVHAVNPYGFAHLTRGNEDGVDLNRNFIDWRKPLPSEHEHTGWLMERIFTSQPRMDEVQEFMASKGEAACKKALVQGQHRFPLGICYGGTGPSWSNQVWQNILAVHAADVPEIVHVDLHSGYGPCAGAVIFPADDISPLKAARAQGWWGARVDYAPSGPSAALGGLSGPIEGSFALHAPSANTLSVTVETGTVEFSDVLDILMKEHQRMAAGQPATPQSRAAIRRAYAPEDVHWQRRAVESFVGVLSDGLNGMAKERARKQAGPACC